MQTLLPYIEALLSILLVAGILLQRSEAALGSAFGESSMGAPRYTRRGFEKLLFNATIVLAVLFALVSIFSLFYR